MKKIIELEIKKKQYLKMIEKFNNMLEQINLEINQINGGITNE